MTAQAVTRHISAGDVELRRRLVDAARQWGGVELKRTHGLTRYERLRIRAYAEVYGIDYFDQFDNHPGGALSPAELAYLPALRREARAGHVGEIVRFRVEQYTWRIIGAAASGAARTFRAFFSWDVLIGALIFAVVFFLLGVANGFASPIGFTNFMIGWAYSHPDEVWGDAQFAALWTLTLGGCGAFFMFCNHLDVIDKKYQQSRHGKNHRHEIENFREQSPFGDASLAQREEIALALLGNGGGFAPQYED